MKKFGFLFIIFFSLIYSGPVLAQEEKNTSEKGEGNFLENLNFEEGTFLGNVNSKLMNLVESVEKWRLAKKDSVRASLDIMETRREDAKDPKPAVKVLTILHISGLALALFVLSLQFVFWTILVLLVIAVIRKLVNFIIGIFRRDHINA